MFGRSRRSNTPSIENVHILLWLLKDASWLHEWKVLGCVVIAPTILVQAYIAWKNRHDRGEFLHSAAIVCWLIANSTWMVGEFFYDDGSRPIAAIFFDLGFILIFLYYAGLVYRKAVPDRSAGAQA